MFYGLFLLIVGLGLVCLFGIISLLIVFTKKVKWRWLWLLSFVVVTISGFYIHHRVVHADFYEFKAHVVKEYQDINEIKIKYINGGSLCVIYLYMEGETEPERMEHIFIDMMKMVNQEPMSNYLKSSSERENKDWVFLEICFLGVEHKGGIFKSELYQHSDWFTDENQQVQIWKNSDTGKEYRYLDYAEY